MYGALSIVVIYMGLPGAKRYGKVLKSYESKLRRGGSIFYGGSGPF